MNNAACICTVGEYYNNIKDWKINLQNYDSYILTDITRQDINDEFTFTYTEEDIRQNLNFFGEVSKKHYWNAHGNRNIIQFFLLFI